MKILKLILVALCLMSFSFILAFCGWRHYRLNADYSNHFVSDGHVPSLTPVDGNEYTYLSRRGTTIRALLRTPSSTASPWSAVVLMGGLGTGARAADLVPSRYVDSGVMVLALDYHLGDLPRPGRRATWWDYLWYPAALENTILDLIDIADWVAAHPQVDPERIALVGVSFGMLVAPAAAAAQERYRALALVYGGAPLGRLAEHNFTVLPRPLRPLIGDLTDTLLAPIEPLRHLPNLGDRPVFYMASSTDEQIPRDTVEAVERSLPGPREIRLVDTRHIHPTNTELIGELTAEVMEWLSQVMPRGD